MLNARAEPAVTLRMPYLEENQRTPQLQALPRTHQQPTSSSLESLHESLSLSLSKAARRSGEGEALMVLRMGPGVIRRTALATMGDM